MADESCVQKLDGRLPFEPTIAAVGQPDGTHASVTNRLIERIGPESSSREISARQQEGRPNRQEVPVVQLRELS